MAVDFNGTVGAKPGLVPRLAREELIKRDEPEAAIRDAMTSAAQRYISVMTLFSVARCRGAGSGSKFGKGSGHKAQLNLCACAAYALAQALDVPLLFEGNDFNYSDVRSALACNDVRRASVS